jgi:exodeoxyribonuclease-5
MKWTPQQEQALRAVRNWLADPSQQVFRLFGYAGTGKTTLARVLAEGVEGAVLFCAYTGKAAHVLRQRGCEGASTIHSLIYRSRDRDNTALLELEADLAGRCQEIAQAHPNDDPIHISEFQALDAEVQRLRNLVAACKQEARRPMFTLNPESPVRDARLVIVDEVSMVDESIGRDLLSYGTKVLVLGDPAQLPPVHGGGFFTEGCQPDFMLTDIQRQAADNPIIALATMIRGGRNPPLGRYGETIVTDTIDPDEAMAADQVLVGRNSTRFATNRRVRSLLGRSGWGPKVGDRLVCLRNNHELGLLNGAIWTADQDAEMLDDQILLNISSEDTPNPLEVLCHQHYFRGEGDDLPWWERKSAEEFDFGYALTVHKSQGSQWRNVALIDESHVFRADRWRWLYTGVTRASERLTLVRS